MTTTTQAPSVKLQPIGEGIKNYKIVKEPNSFINSKTNSDGFSDKGKSLPTEEKQNITPKDSDSTEDKKQKKEKTQLTAKQAKEAQRQVLIKECAKNHNKIKAHLKRSQKVTYAIAIPLSFVKENKYHKVLGYKSFEAYSDEDLGITSNHAVNWAKLGRLLTLDTEN